MQYRKHTGEVRDGWLSIRITKDERKQLKALAAAAGVSVGGYLLGLALGDKIGRSMFEKPDPNQMKLDL